MKKRSLFLVVFLIFLFLKTEATHIVGGEFQITYAGRGYNYNVSLNMYYDDINAATGLLNEDLSINVILFSKATNQEVRVVILNRISDGFITYTNNGCSDPGIIRTRLLKYIGQMDMTGLNEPLGYYMAWERCCRNEVTKNIVHFDFFGTSIDGQTFYIEVPPSIKNGIRFVNSSPTFSVVPAQYLCKNNMALIDFSGKDADGDSLVYTMTTPLRGHTNTSTPNSANPQYPEPAPYDSIGWMPGYEAYNAIPGNPALRIDRFTGLLRVNPNDNGLFAFAVMCEEYRNGVRIGRVQRDFQFLVKDCPPSHPPRVGIGGASVTNWGTTTSDTLLVKLNKDTCYTIFVTDSSASFFNTNDKITISYGNTTLPTTVLAFSPSEVTVTPSQDTTTMNMCFSTCDKILIEKDSVYYLDIIVEDGDASTCPRRSDTLRTYVYVDVDETNDKPKIGTTLDPQVTYTTYTDSVASFIVYGIDPEQYDMTGITAEGIYFDLDLYNMIFKQVYEGPDSIAYRFLWKPTCDMLRKRTEYKLRFTLKDKSCISSHSVSKEIQLFLRDAETGLSEYKPTNLITPNGDSLNDCFYLDKLPADNCSTFFKSVEIRNRWGGRVFYSEDRNFKWCADNVVDGVYYYGIDLGTKQVKGWLEIIR